MIADLPNWQTIGQLAEKTGLSPWLIRKEIKQGRLRARRVGRCVRILDEDASAWMRNEGSGAQS